jgi:hypothetical protein
MAFQPVPSNLAGQTITDAQTVSWAQQGGFTGTDLQIAVAVSFTENASRRVDAVHTNSNGSHDLGEWQINDQAHPDLLQQFPMWWSVQNANMAKSVHDASGWGAWTTFADGDYKANMDRAAAAIKSAGGASAVGSPDAGSTIAGQTNTSNILTQIGNSVAAIAQAVFKAGQWMAEPKNWTRIALVSLGGIVVIGGVLSATKNQVSGVAGAAAKTVAALPTPAGKAARTVAKAVK